MKTVKSVKKEAQALAYAALNFFQVPALVLLYHRVTEIGNDPQLLCVSTNNFRRQIEYLKSYYNLLPIDEFHTILAGKGKFPKRAVIITFDDGYADNYYQALPILEELDAQALFFISTCNIETNKEFWWDYLDRIFYGSTPQNILEISLGGKIKKYSLLEPHSRQEAYADIHKYLRGVGSPEQDRLLAELGSWAHLSNDARTTHRMMNADEIKHLSLSRHAVIGAHGHDHIALAKASAAEQEQNINQSKIVLKKIIGQRIRYFSYPFGQRNDFSKTTSSLVKKTGFDFAHANFPAPVYRWTNHFRIPRILVRDWDVHQLHQRLQIYGS